MMDPGSLHIWTRMNSMLILQLILLCPAAVAGCNRDAERQLILAKVKAHFLDFLGPVPQNEKVQEGRRGLHRRHALDTTETRSLEEEHISQVIVFPIQGVLCERLQPDGLPEHRGVFTYIFQSSIHILSHEVTSVQLWFYTGPVVVQSSPLEAASNNSSPEAEILMLSEEGQVPLATMAVPASEGWTAFHFRSSFFHYLFQNVFVLFIRCLGCPCVADAAKIPFLVATTKPKAQDQTESPSRIIANLTAMFQHNAVAHPNCHRTSINISFEELGWDNWIVHPSSFMFYYCHGNCSGAHTYIPNSQNCCAALPGTMQSLRVRTTSDGGYSFRYETVPNIITQDCVCM
ncbi:inhibin alpha chain [Crotalus tigris]|uniref:inhibin alpha chain n=1 Tax=Crotalus tigris TaxID=88082 RepID=UPI00192F56EB|nr:inhibin alpha chain [Crotalus tigris]